jgi:15-cis-phytoene synthase/lycopene beta-cyclase
LILLQALVGLPRAIPFGWKDKPRVGVSVAGKGRKEFEVEEMMVQTLPRRPWVGLGWIGLSLVGAAGLFLSPTTIEGIMSNPSVILSPTTWTWTINEGPYFYLSSILIWISPVLALLTTLGARVEIKQDWYAWVMGTGYLWMVDSIAIRAGAWAIDEQRTLGWFVWKGLPVE